MKKSISIALALGIALTALPALAVSKETIQLQTQIADLQKAVALLQQSNDERMGVLKDLVQQTADSVNKMSVTVDGLQKHSAARQEAETGKLDQVSGQVQSLNDSLDELKARLNAISKALGDVQNQQQSINAKMDNFSQPAAAAPTGNPPAPQPDAFTAPGIKAPAPAVKKGKPVAEAPAAPPVEDLYQTAYGDYNAAKYTLAAAEFNDVIKFYPDSNLSGNAYFYLGEIDYRASKFAAAAKNYDKVLEQYPGNNKTAICHLRKGQSLIALKQTDAGVRELRSLIQRFPTSPEALQARSKLNGMGVPITPRK